MNNKKYADLIKDSPNYRDILNKTGKSRQMMMVFLFWFGLLFSLYYFFFIIKCETIYFPLQVLLVLVITLLSALNLFFSKTKFCLPRFFLILDLFLLVMSLRHSDEIYIEIILISIFPILSYLNLEKKEAVFLNVFFFITCLLLFFPFNSYLGLRQSDTSYHIILMASFVIISIIAHYSSVENQEHLSGMIKEVFFDNLTELPAWPLLKLRISSPCDETLTIFRISNFQEIQKSLGVEDSNKILQSVRDKLTGYLESDCVEIFKLRGNDFVLLWTSTFSLSEVEKYIKKMMETFNIFSIRVDENIVYLKSIAGTVPVIGEAVDVLHNAEYAVQLAQLKQKPQILYSDREKPDSCEEFNKPFQVLLDCFENGRIQIYYQPIIDCNSRDILKVEALVRFFDIHGRTLDLGPILESAYSTGMNQKLTNYVLKQSSKWALENDIDIAINIGFEDLINQDVIKSILTVLQKFRNTDRVLTLEVLESSTIMDSALSYNNLIILRNSGALIALDDFGKGFANIDRILSLQPDIIKFDGALIKELPFSEDARYLVSMISKLAVRNGMTTVAEHVENAGIMKCVEQFPIDQAQGFYFGKPAPVLEYSKT